MIPARKTNSLIEQLNSMDSNVQVHEFAFLKIKRDAEKVRKESIPEGDILLGMIATIEGDINEVHSRFKNAIQFIPSSPDAYSNYAASLNKLGMFSQAVEPAYKAWEFGKTTTLFKSLITALFYAGKFREAYDLLKKETPKLSQDDKKYLNTFEHIANLDNIYNFIEVKNIPDDVIVKLVDYAISILHHNNIHRFSVTIIEDNHDNEEWLTYLIEIHDKNYETLICLEDELDEKLEGNSLVNEHFTVEYHVEAPNLTEMLNKVDSYVDNNSDSFTKFTPADLQEISDILE
jgi:tetratricopeptide (TPR) repeat protein